LIVKIIDTELTFNLFLLAVDKMFFIPINAIMIIPTLVLTVKTVIFIEEVNLLWS